MLGLRLAANSFAIHLSLAFVLVATSRPLTQQGTVQDRLQQAAQLLSEQKFQAAREILEELLHSTVEKAPPQTYYQLALCYVKQAEWKKAEEALQGFLR